MSELYNGRASRSTLQLFPARAETGKLFTGKTKRREMLEYTHIYTNTTSLRSRRWKWRAGGDGENERERKAFLDFPFVVFSFREFLQKFFGRIFPTERFSPTSVKDRSFWVKKKRRGDCARDPSFRPTKRYEERERQKPKYFWGLFSLS